MTSPMQDHILRALHGGRLGAESTLSDEAKKFLLTKPVKAPLPKYTSVCGQTLASLDALVNEALTKGYSPHGPMQISPTGLYIQVCIL